MCFITLISQQFTSSHMFDQFIVMFDVGQNMLVPVNTYIIAALKKKKKGCSFYSVSQNAAYVTENRPFNSPVV